MGSCISCPIKKNNIIKISYFSIDRMNNENIKTNDCENEKDEIYYKKQLLDIYKSKVNNNFFNKKSYINDKTGQIISNCVKEINILFLFNDKKELYLTVNSNQSFEEVEKLLREKYNWINFFTDISYHYSNNSIIKEKTKTISELGINNGDTLLIKAK